MSRLGKEKHCDIENRLAGGARPSGRRELRRKPRIRAALPVTVRGADETGRGFELESRVENISASGLYMRLKRHVAGGSALSVVVHFARLPVARADSAGIIAHGEVVRSVIEPDGSCGVALCFSSYRPL